MDGGSSSQPSTMTQTSIPEYANPYVRAMLGQAMKTVFNIQPSGSAPPVEVGPDQRVLAQYVGGIKQGGMAEGGVVKMASGGAPDDKIGGFDILGLRPPPVYEGLGAQDYRVAGFSKPQLDAYDIVRSYKGPLIGGADEMIRPYADARSATTQAGIAALTKPEYAPANINGAYQAQRFSPDYMLGQFVQGSFTDDGNATKFMDPYIQNVVNINKREAIRDNAIQNAAQQAQATQAGAFGSGRDAIVRAEAQRNLNTRLGDIQNTGLQSAFTNAQNQYNTEAARNFAAQQAREQAKQFAVGSQLQAGQMNEQSRQFGANLGLQSQLANEQSRQFGANLGMQRLQTALNAAVAQGQITQAEADQRLRAGQQQFDQHAGVVSLLSQMGGQDQALRQQQINNAYGDFVNQQNFPYKQLGFMSDMLRGLPLANVTTYQAPPNPISQIAGLGTAGIAGLGLYNATRGA